MKKSIISMVVLACMLFAAHSQVSFTNTTELQFKSEADETPDTGFDRLRNQFDISGDFKKFSFNARLRMQIQPFENRDRLFLDGVTFVTGFDRFPSDDSWVRANAYIHPIDGLEFAFGTNIDYALGLGSNWGDYETDDYSSYIHKAYFGKNNWAKNGFALKYEIAGFELGVALPAYQYVEHDSGTTVKTALTKTTFALKYTLKEKFSIGAAYFADFKSDMPQTIAANIGFHFFEAVPLNLFADYTTSNKTWEQNSTVYSHNEFMNLGINIPIYLDNLTIEPEFAYSILLGSSYKELNAANPWFGGLLVSYEFEHLMPKLWLSYASGYSKQHTEFRMDIKPEVFVKTKFGTLCAAYNIILQRNTGSPTIFFGWELPISWTVLY